MNKSSIQDSYRCPNCNRLLYSGDLIESSCPDCKTTLHFQITKLWQAYLTTFAVVGLVAALTFRGEAGGAWLFIPILLVVPVFVFSKIFFCEGRIVTQKPKTFIPFFPFYLTVVVVSFFEMFLGLGGLTALLGTRRELLEQVDMLSFPLGYVFPRFAFSPTISFLDLMGILLGNSFFWAFVLYLCFQIGHAAVRRGRVQRIGLSGSQIDDDD